MAMPEPYTTRSIVELCERTAPALAALSEIVANHATRRVERPVPAGIEADAAVLLAATRTVLSREPGWRAPLGLRARPVWSELEAKLALAQVGLPWFKARYYRYDAALGAYRRKTGGRAHAVPLPREERNARLVGRAMAALERQLTEIERDH
jgi:hypothetical protein